MASSLLLKSAGHVAQYQSKFRFLCALSPIVSKKTFKSSDSRIDDQYDGNPIQGFQSREHEFYQARSQDIEVRSSEDLEKEAKDYEENTTDTFKQERKRLGLDKYENMSSVSLRGVMQSNVPEPFNPQGRNPTHLNMPGGGVKMQEKYISSNMQRVHPSKQYSTDAKSRYSTENVQCPQGVQGLDCAQYKLWLRNCQQYGLDCAKQIDDFQSSRKTLAEIFKEQEKMIYEAVSKNPAFQNENHDSIVYQQNMQGVQGFHDCNYYKQWLYNCGHYKINTVGGNAEKMVETQKRHYSTSSGGSHEVGNVSDQQLSQRQKLKRAIKEYGATVIVFHVGISLMSLGGFYLAVSSGIDVVGLLAKVGVVESKTIAGASTFVVAYAVHKVFAPVRIATTLTCTPFIVRYLRKIGFLNVPKGK